MPPDSSTVPTTIETVAPALTSGDVDSFMYLGAGGFFLTITLLVAIFVRVGS